MDQIAAQAFAERWVQSWNDHDLDAILKTFADDIVFTSPHAVELVEGSDGIIRGKDALRRYWEEGLRRVSDLHFEILGVYVGIHTVVINYRNQNGGLVNEVLIFDGDMIVAGHGTYIGRTL